MSRLRTASGGLALITWLALSLAQPASGQSVKSSGKCNTAFGKLPLCFEANRGQTNSQIAFLSRGQGHSLFLSATESVLSLARPAQPPSKERASVRMRLVGANPRPAMTGQGKLPGLVNYLIGNDPSKWRTHIPTYRQVRYHNVYPGIDLLYYGNQQKLEYDFVVAPGAETKAIGLEFAGAERMRITASGDLALGRQEEALRWQKPVVYQTIGGKRRAVAGRYVRKGRNRVGFAVARYDRTRPLVIDPTLIYSSYLGGSGNDFGQGMAIDSAGSVYAATVTNSLDFPTKNALYPTYIGGLNDTTITKFSPDGSALVYSTYLGGADQDFPGGVAVDSSGSAVVAGFTRSNNFPVVNGFQTAHAGVPSQQPDGYVAKLSPDGSSLLYSTYIGGSGIDRCWDVSIDAAGVLYVAGETGSTDFPVTSTALQPNLAGAEDIFVAKIDPSQSGVASLLYATYLGGSGDEGLAVGIPGIKVDAAGNMIVAGTTSSRDFPTTIGAYQTTFGGGSTDAFVTKIKADGSGLIFSTYLGGSGDENEFSSLAIAQDGSVYVAGQTSSLNFPVTPNAYQAFNAGNFNIFVTKLAADGSSILYSTYFGGSGFDLAAQMALDPRGNLYFVGQTTSIDFPILNAVQSTYGGDPDDVCLVKFNADWTLSYSTYLGGNGDDEGFDLAVDAKGNAYVMNATSSTNFPTTPGAFQTTTGGGYDAYVAKIGDVTAPTSSGSLSGSLGLNGWYTGDVTASLTAKDDPGGSGVASLTYSATGAQPIGITNVPGSTASFGITTEGVTTLNFFATDWATNAETPAHSLVVHLDKTPPSTGYSVSPSPNGAGWNNTPVTVTLTPTDATSGVASTSYTLDSGPPQTYTAPFTVSGDAVHTLTFHSTDNAGNTEAVNSRTLKIDTTAPVTTASVPPAPGGWYNAPVTVTLSWSDNLSGVAATFYTVDGGTQQTYAGPFTLALKSGVHTVLYWSVDVAGNTEVPKSLTLSFDTTPPSITASANPGSLRKNTGMMSVTVSGTIKDTASGVNASSASYTVTDQYGLVQPSGSISVGAKGSFSFSVALDTTLKSGSTSRTYTITVTASDNAGNVGSTSFKVTAK